MNIRILNIPFSAASMIKLLSSNKSHGYNVRDKILSKLVELLPSLAHIWTLIFTSCSEIKYAHSIFFPQMLFRQHGGAPRTRRSGERRESARDITGPGQAQARQGPVQTARPLPTGYVRCV